MITWNLTTIDWTAIGAIVTFVALIATFLALYFSNRHERKNRQLQMLLLRQEQQQKGLDEMVENILEMLSDIDLLKMNNYSQKIKGNNICIEDKYQIDNISNKSEQNYRKLQLQVIKLNEYASARTMLDHLMKIRADYYRWAKGAALILAYLKDSPAVQKANADVVERTREEMLAKCIEMNPDSPAILDECKIPFVESPIADYKNTLVLYSSLLTYKLLEEIMVFMEELKAFVKKEQIRIDNIVNDN